jgi:hypothetical protein
MQAPTSGPGSPSDRISGPSNEDNTQSGRNLKQSVARLASVFRGAGKQKDIAMQAASTQSQTNLVPTKAMLAEARAQAERFISRTDNQSSKNAFSSDLPDPLNIHREKILKTRTLLLDMDLHHAKCTAQLRTLNQEFANLKPSNNERVTKQQEILSKRSEITRIENLKKETRSILSASMKELNTFLSAEIQKKEVLLRNLDNDIASSRSFQKPALETARLETRLAILELKELQRNYTK